MLLIFYPSASFPFVCLSQALISVQSTSLFLSVAHSFLFVALLFFFLFSFVCCVSAPPVSHYTNPIYEADKHMPTHCVSMRASLFSFLYLFRFFHQRLPSNSFGRRQ